MRLRDHEYVDIEASPMILSILTGVPTSRLMEINRDPDIPYRIEKLQDGSGLLALIRDERKEPQNGNG